MIGDATVAAPNPWFSMWRSPRATIRNVVRQNPERKALLLAVLTGIDQSLNRATSRGWGDNLPLLSILALTVLIGAFSGVVGFYVWSGLIHWTGKSIGGRATPKEVRAAVAWGNVPSVWGLALWPFALALFGVELFTNTTPRLDSSPVLFASFIGFVLAQVVFGVWAIVAVLQALAEVQGFSAWKALGNAIMAGMVIVIPLLLLVGLVMLSSAL